MVSQKRKKVVILGGGFGGVYTALKLDKLIGREVDVTLVNRENFFLFTPMLHEVAASDLDPTHIVNPIRAMLRNVKFFEGDVESIDLENRRVGVAHGEEHHHHDLEYDHLVIALGSTTNFFNLPGLQANSITMKSLGDAIKLRNHMITNLEEADFECCPHVREPLLTYVVAGGGFSGVETIAGMNDFLRESLRFYPNLTESMVRIVLVHPGKTILPELGEKLGEYTQRKLAERGVEIRTGTRVVEVTGREIVLNDGTRLTSNTLIWTAGTSPHPLLASLPCQTERGRIVVNECLEVPGWPGVWALGDCAVVPDSKTGKPHPTTAQHALRQGNQAGTNIAAVLAGGKAKPFRFKTLGQLAAIGRRTGVANVFGFNFSGFLAWWMWRTIYLSKLPRLEKKIRVAIDWTLDMFFPKDIVQFTTGLTTGISTPAGHDQEALHAEEAVSARR